MGDNKIGDIDGSGIPGQINEQQRKNTGKSQPGKSKKSRV